MSFRFGLFPLLLVNFQHSTTKVTLSLSNNASKNPNNPQPGCYSTHTVLFSAPDWCESILISCRPQRLIKFQTARFSLALTMVPATRKQTQGQGGKQVLRLHWEPPQLVLRCSEGGPEAYRAAAPIFAGITQGCFIQVKLKARNTANKRKNATSLLDY